MSSLEQYIWLSSWKENKTVLHPEGKIKNDSLLGVCVSPGMLRNQPEKPHRPDWSPRRNESAQGFLTGYQASCVLNKHSS